MIPRSSITAWRATAPWPDEAQVVDLHRAGQLPGVRLEEVVSTFRTYLEREGLEVSMAALASNLSTKLGDGDFRSDVLPLLAAGVEHDADEAASWVEREILGRVPPTS